MKAVSLCFFGAVLGACVSLAPVAHAQAQPGPSLSEVQKAYADVDYEKTQSLARAAIQQGGNDRAATSQLYLLWATASAALEQADEARTAFTYALAANPELKLDRNLSPKIRGPYLEARGSLANAGDRPPLEVTLRPRKQQLELGLYDALHVVTSLVVATRAVGATTFSRIKFDAAPTRRVATPNGPELQFFVRALDRYDNVLFELGTEDEPQRLLSVTGDKPPAPASARGSDASPVPYYVTSGALAVLGVAAGGVATAMYLRREDAARQWNGPSCERPGLSRAEQCGSVDDRRLRDERLAIGLTAAGGALLVGSVVSFVLAPSAHAKVVLDAGAGNVMLHLRTTL